MVRSAPCVGAGHCCRVNGVHESALHAADREQPLHSREAVFESRVELILALKLVAAADALRSKTLENAT